MAFEPVPYGYRYVFRKGDRGWDVWAFQLNFPELSADGVFGDQTFAVVKKFQEANDLTNDGVAGLLTQRKLSIIRSAAAALAEKLPSKLLTGIMEGESGFAVAACSPHPSDAGFDLGVYQDSVLPAEKSQATYAASFNIKLQSEEVSAKLRAKKDEFYSWPTLLTHAEAWWCAILLHNWPAAAVQKARGTIDNWKYTSTYFPAKNIPDNGMIVGYNADGTQRRQYSMATRAQWIIDASGHNLETGNEWTKYYVDSKTMYVSTLEVV